MRNTFDPLTFIPTPDAIRQHLTAAEQLAKRLRILLRVSERIQATQQAKQAPGNVEGRVKNADA